MTQATPQSMTGTVEKVEYTHGGAGNQWTTISGVRYCTFWDTRTRDWKENDQVTFTCREGKLWENSTELLMASNITKCVEPVTVVETANYRLPHNARIHDDCIGHDH